MTKTDFNDHALKQLTKRLVVNCVRTPLEPFHAGRGPISKIGDGSDIMITDTEGQAFPFSELSHVSDTEMKDLMITITDRVYTFLSNLEDPEFLEMMSQYDASIAKRDAPKTDRKMLERKYFRLLKELDKQEKQE